MWTFSLVFLWMVVVVVGMVVVVVVEVVDVVDVVVVVVSADTAAGTPAPITIRLSTAMDERKPRIVDLATYQS
jgi:hypothetical protein